MRRLTWAKSIKSLFSTLKTQRRRRSLTRLSAALEVFEERLLLSASSSDDVDASYYDDQPDVLEIAVADATTQEGGTLDFAITFPGGVSEAQTISYSVWGDSAIEGADFESYWGEVEITNDTPIVISVPTNDDIADEYDETVIFSAYSYASSADATGTIQDNDAAPFIDILNDSQSVEEEVGYVEFRIGLSHPSEKNVSVSFQTIDDTAKSPGDYQHTEGIAQLGGGYYYGPESYNTTASIYIAVNPDGLDEFDERMLLRFSDAQNATLPVGPGGNYGIAIIDSDPAPYLEVESDGWVSEGGQIDVAIQLSQVSAKDVSFNFSTADVLATAGEDYNEVSGTVTLPAGQVATVITVQTNDDSEYDPDESFEFVVENVVNANVYEPEHSIYIYDYDDYGGDDGVPAIIPDIDVDSDNDGRITEDDEFFEDAFPGAQFLSEPETSDSPDDHVEKVKLSLQNPDGESLDGIVAVLSSNLLQPLAWLDADRTQEITLPFSVDLTNGALPSEIFISSPVAGFVELILELHRPGDPVTQDTVALEAEFFDVWAGYKPVGHHPVPMNVLRDSLHQISSEAQEYALGYFIGEPGHNYGTINGVTHPQYDRDVKQRLQGYLHSNNVTTSSKMTKDQMKSFVSDLMAEKDKPNKNNIGKFIDGCVDRRTNAEASGRSVHPAPWNMTDADIQTRGQTQGRTSRWKKHVLKWKANRIASNVPGALAVVGVAAAGAQGVQLLNDILAEPHFQAGLLAINQNDFHKAELEWTKKDQDNLMWNLKRDNFNNVAVFTLLDAIQNNLQAGFDDILRPAPEA